MRSVSSPVASLARQQLREIDQQIAEVLSRDGARLDPYSKAHLVDAKSHIDRVLDAAYLYNPGGGGGSISIDLGSIFGQDEEKE